MKNRTMGVSTAALYAGQEVTVLDTVGEIVNVLDQFGNVHTILVGDLLDLHDYCEHEYDYCTESAF